MHKSLSHPEQWIDLYADALYAYAMRMVSDPDQAQNLVQETFLAALKSRNSFEGKSSEKTWMISILRHKIMDFLRSKYREVPLSTLTPNEMNVDLFFDHVTEMAKQPPGSWDLQPDQILENKDFWKALEECINRLPSRAADAFKLKVMETIDSDEVCKVLNVSATNLWTLLHRSRLQLRACLEKNWFEYE